MQWFPDWWFPAGLTMIIIGDAQNSKLRSLTARGLRRKGTEEPPLRSKQMKMKPWPIVNKPCIRFSRRTIYYVLSLVRNIRDADISRLFFIPRITLLPCRCNPEINLARFRTVGYLCGYLATELEWGHPVRVEVIRFELRRSQRFLRFPRIPAGAAAPPATAATAAAAQQQQQQQGEAPQGSRTPLYNQPPRRTVPVYHYRETLFN